MSNENKVVLPNTVSDEQIKAVFLANGFTIKEGLTGLKPYVYQAARALLATGGQAQAQADKQRMDAFMHFMQANCYNPELNADETRNILFNLEQIRAWRSGIHDDYVERLYGRKIHSMGGQEQGEGASTGCAADGAALATGRPAVVASQAQEGRA